MFTGIIRDVGVLKKIEKKTGLWKIGVDSPVLYKETAVSDSICVSGVCLTVVDKKNSLLFFEAVEPTLDTTNLKRLRINSTVNLESSLRANDKMGGHFVLGHVDCESQIKRITKKSDFWVFEIKFSSQHKSLLVDKGSVAVDGISLTVATVKSGYFTVNIIPHTYSNTILKNKHTGDWVNVEYDYLLKSQGHK